MAKESAKESAKSELKTVKAATGSVPVDEIALKHHPGKKIKVYSQGAKVYATTLNQSNVSANNNKFYILQIL